MMVMMISIYYNYIINAKMNSFVTPLTAFHKIFHTRCQRYKKEHGSSQFIFNKWVKPWGGASIKLVDLAYLFQS